MFTLQKMCPITSVDFNFSEDSQMLKIYVGDEMGFVRVQDASEILRKSKLKTIDLVKGNSKRNPYRKEEMKVSSAVEISEIYSSVLAGKESLNKPLFEEKYFK